MVPRSPHQRPRTGGIRYVVRNSFKLWRRLLTTVISRARRSSAPIRHSTTVALRAIISPPAEPGRRGGIAPRQAVALAALALGIGTVGSVLANPAGILAGALSAAVASAWVIARYPVMRVVYQPADGSASEQLTLSWAIGVLPYLFAFTPPLRFLAWLVGAALAYRTLAATGLHRRAARTVAAGFGIEAAVFAILVVYRNIDVLLRLAIGR